MSSEKDKRKSTKSPNVKRASSKKTVPAKKKAAPVNELSALHTLSRRISADLSVEDVISTALKELCAIMDPDLCFLYICQDDQLVLKDRCQKTGKAGPLLPEVKRVGECLCGRAASISKPVYSKNIHKDPLCTLAECKDAGVRSFAALPLIGREGIVGVLSLTSFTVRDFSKQDAFLEILAGQVATALDNALVRERLQQQSDMLRHHLDERAKTEVMLKKSNRALMALSRCNEILAQETSESELLHSICRILVEEGGYKLAWIGYAEEEAGGRVRPVAQCGYEEGYLETLHITWADTEQGRGPTGTAIRTGKPSAVKDIRNDPRFSAWRAEALKRGYASSMAFPLMAGGKAFGALNVYSAESDAFDADESALLEQLTGDLSYGITTLRMREAHQKSEEALQESREKYRSLFENANDAIYLIDPETRKIIECNQKASEMTGYHVEELIRMTVEDLHPGQERNLLPEKFRMIREKGKAAGITGVRHQRKDGSLVDIEVNASTLMIGGRWLNLSIVRDISERKRMEDVLRNSADQLQTIIDNTPAVIYAKGIDGRYLLINRRYTELFHVSKEAVLGMTDHELFPAAAADAFRANDRMVLERGEAAQFDETVPHDDGLHNYISVKFPLSDANGIVYGVCGISTDITERKRTEAALRTSEERFRKLLDQSPVAMAVYDLSERSEYLNNKFIATFGYTLEDIPTVEHWWPLAYPDPGYRQQVKKEWHEAVEKGIQEGEEFDHIEANVTCKDGTVGAFIIFGIPVGDKILVIFQDITERKQMEDRLRESEDRLRVIFDAAQEGIVQISSAGAILYANRRMAEMFGSPLDKVIGSSFIDHVHPDQKTASEALMRQLGSGEVESVSGERHFIRSAGSDFWGHISARRLAGPDGRSKAMVGIITDITESKNSVKALMASEEKYRALFEESKDVIYISTPDGKFIDINPAGVALFGYSSKEELLSIDIAGQLYVEPSERTRFRQTIDKQGFVTDYEVRMKKKSGEELAVMTLTSSAVRDEQGNIVAYRGIMRDITEHRKLEQQLRQSQKMEAIGQLAGGIAHDFNNILSAIVGYGGMMQMKMAPDDANRLNVEQILSAADRAANLTHSLLAFSRKQIINPKPVNLNDIIKKVEKLLSRLIGEDVELHTQTSDRDLTVWADGLQIEQVLMNLATNARDAMPEGGRLIIKTEAIDLRDELMMQRDILKSGMYALLTVTDTGRGMDEETQQKIFEPFFTTKDVGKGTGLGLAMVYGIIKQHNGYILASSRPGKGSVFSIYLPLIGHAGREPEHRQERLPMQRGTETILLAEDNEAVRKMTRTILTDHGYTVIEAADGEEAIQQFHEHQDRVQLLLLDVVLPKKNGREVYEEVKRTRPGVNVLFTSGYTADVIHAKGIADEGLHFISKPAGMRELLQKIRDVLDA